MLQPGACSQGPPWPVHSAVEDPRPIRPIEIQMGQRQASIAPPHPERLGPSARHAVLGRPQRRAQLKVRLISPGRARKDCAIGADLAAIAWRSAGGYWPAANGFLLPILANSDVASLWFSPRRRRPLGPWARWQPSGGGRVRCGRGEAPVRPVRAPRLRVRSPSALAKQPGWRCRGICMHRLTQEQHGRQLHNV